MTFCPKRVHQIMRYAVSVASNADDYRQRELGPIHLIKYVYLADLAYAKKHGGATYSGVRWRFHHFGPWATEVWTEIETAMAFRGIRHRSFRGQYKDDVSRWGSEDRELQERTECELPFEIMRATKSAVHEFANDTAGLLQWVYRTPPMLHAAPAEDLDFLTVIQDQGDTKGERATGESVAEPSKSARKRQKAAHETLRARFQDALKKRRQARSSAAKPRPPRYDEVFAKGQRWLDSLGGGPVEEQAGELVVSEAIWKSATRTEPEIP